MFAEQACVTAGIHRKASTAGANVAQVDANIELLTHLVRVRRRPPALELRLRAGAVAGRKNRVNAANGPRWAQGWTEQRVDDVEHSLMVGEVTQQEVSSGEGVQ